MVTRTKVKKKTTWRDYQNLIRKKAPDQIMMEVEFHLFNDSTSAKNSFTDKINFNSQWLK